jgi:microcystin-dependent protein
MVSGAHITMGGGGGTIKGLPASANNGEAVRHEQVIALTASISGITALFMPKTGGTFTGPVNFGSQVTTGVPTPTTTDAIASKGYVDTTLASFGGLPVATVIDYAGASVPTGWLPCDGAAVSRATYASLFAVIGVLYGVGDGSTTFNVPDSRGRVSIGVGTGAGLTARTLAATGGEEDHVLTEAEMASHYHATGLGTAGSTDPFYNGSDVRTGPTENIGAGGAASTVEGRTDIVGSDDGHNTMQPFIAFNKIIKH